MPPVARRHSPSARQGNQEKSTLGSSRYGNRGMALNRSTLSQLRLSFSPSFSVSPPLPPSFSLSLWATRLVLRSFCLIRSVALTLSLSQRHFPPNGFLQIVIETSDTPVNGRGVSGRTSPGRERVVELFFARRTRSARAKWRDEWRDQNLDERRASHTWSNLKSYQSHLCQFSCLVVSPCSRRPSGPPSRPLSPSLSLSLSLFLSASPFSCS